MPAAIAFHVSEDRALFETSPVQREEDLPLAVHSLSSLSLNLAPAQRQKKAMKTWRLSYSLCLCPHLQGVFSKLKFGGIGCTKDCAKAPFPNLLFQYPLLSHCVQKYSIMSVKESEAGQCTERYRSTTTRVSLPISLVFEVVFAASSRWYSKFFAEEGDWKSTLLQGGALTDSASSPALSCFAFSVSVRSYAQRSIHDASLVMHRHACVHSGLKLAQGI